MPSARFDAAYYDRFYRKAQTQVSDAQHYSVLGSFVAGYAALLGVEIGGVLDLGCGLGRWRTVAKRRFPKATYIGVETSAYLCDELGWAQGQVEDYSGSPADLVVCQGVLQYLPARSAAKAIKNLARLTRGLLYLEVLTQEDWDRHCDQERTDGDVFLRSAEWYRTRLGRQFESLGGGLFLPKRSHVVRYELEKPF